MLGALVPGVANFKTGGAGSTDIARTLGFLAAYAAGTKRHIDPISEH